MPEARLASGLWVAAYLARLRLAAIPAYVARRGDDTAGAILVKLATMDGRAKAYERRFDMAANARRWEILAEGLESEVDQILSRASARDTDLWLIEVEDPKGRHLLAEDGLASG